MTCCLAVVITTRTATEVIISHSALATQRRLLICAKSGRMRLLFVFLLCLSASLSYDMIVGDTVHKKMVFHQRVKDFAIPFKKRIKTLSYSDPEKRIIKGIATIDNDFSHASANVTEGGVGFSYVTVRMKSQRSHPLNFEVEIYV